MRNFKKILFIKDVCVKSAGKIRRKKYVTRMQERASTTEKIIATISMNNDLLMSGLQVAFLFVTALFILVLLVPTTVLLVSVIFVELVVKIMLLLVLILEVTVCILTGAFINQRVYTVIHPKNI